MKRSALSGRQPTHSPRRGSYQPHVVQLEDRLCPGQTLGGYLVGPNLGLPEPWGSAAAVALTAGPRTTPAQAFPADPAESFRAFAGLTAAAAPDATAGDHGRPAGDPSAPAPGAAHAGPPPARRSQPALADPVGQGALDRPLPDPLTDAQGAEHPRPRQAPSPAAAPEQSAAAGGRADTAPEAGRPAVEGAPARTPAGAAAPAAGLNQAVTDAGIAAGTPASADTPAAGPEAAPPSAPGTAPAATVRQQAVQRYDQLPVDFEANRGQTDGQVRFLTHGPGYTLFLTATEAVAVLSKPTPPPAAAANPAAGADPRALLRAGGLSATAAPAPEASVVRMQLVGANPSAQVVGLDELPGKSNYFLGNDPSKWLTDVPHYGKVEYQNVYPGINLVYYGTSQKQVEFDFVVAPGADPGAIQLAYQGAQGLSQDGQGNLLVHTASGDLTQHVPVVYQEVHGVKQAVAGRYVVRAGQPVGFQVAGYDTSRALVIDPVVGYSSFLGGNDQDEGYGIAVDGSGNVYVTGYTTSGNFPTTAGAFQTTFGGGDAFVTKVNAAGSAVAYSSFLGGSGDDYGYGIAVDGAGNAYVTGWTASADFPTTAGAFQTTYGGNQDAFVTKVNAAGSALAYSSFLGGNSYDVGQGIAVDGAGNAYVTGYTGSTNFPTTAGAFQTTSGDGVYSDVFVTKVNAAGSALVYSSFLGGSHYDYGQGIAVDAAGNAYVTGLTHSPNFPTTAGAFQTTYGGGYDGDAFVTKVNAAGSALAYSSFLGGNSDDWGYGIAVDAAGNAYVTGWTASANFPTTAGAFQTTSSGGGLDDAFVTKVNAAGSALAYSSFLGGSGGGIGLGIAVDGAGNAYVTGTAAGSNFPTTAGAFQTTYGGGGDAFVTKVNAAGSALAYSSFLGGNGYDVGQSIAVDAAGNAYVTGWTASADFPTTAGAFQTAFGGGSEDAFVTKPGLGLPPALVPNADSEATGTTRGETGSELLDTAPGADGGSGPGDGFSDVGVRYADGTVQLTTDDLASAGFGTAWGQTRSWTNGPGYATNSNGPGTLVTELPHLIQAASDNRTIVLVTNGTNARYFDLDPMSGAYQARFFDQDQLAANATSGEYVVTDTAGDQLHFFDFSSASSTTAGEFKSFTDPAGNTTQVVAFDANGHATEVRHTNVSGSTTTIDSYLYTYLPTSDVNAGLLANVTFRRSTDNGNTWTTIREVEYDYYDGMHPYGNKGDLEDAILLDSADNVLDTDYYRYYTPSDIQDGNGNTIGYAGGLKYVFNAPSYARLAAAVGNPTTAADAAVAPYADNYFQYDASHRVTQETVQGAGSSAGATNPGLGTFTYAYTIGTSPDGFNNWHTRTTETLPDGTQNLVYTNAYGEVMLTAFQSGGRQWITYHQYDAQGRLLLTALPSAVSGFDDSQASLNVSLNANAGLIATTDYYQAGDPAPGYQKDTLLRQGAAGTPVLQSTTQYATQTANAVTIHPVAGQTVYRNADGSGAETTSYAYAYFPGTNQVQTMTITKPTVTASQNGPGTPDVETTTYDADGRVVSTTDGDNHTNAIAYDAVTGAVSQTVTDVGGLNLTTTIVSDALGREIKRTDPAGHVTATVYLDPLHLMATYAGWDSTKHVPTGPTQVTRVDRANGYTETFTTSVAPAVDGNGNPTGGEFGAGSTYSYAGAGLQTLARAYTNTGGQVIRSDAYFKLAGVTYATAPYPGMVNSNYDTTLNAYDSRGRLAQTINPTGTINQTDYDALGRVSDTQVGTSATNLVMVSQNVYDNGGVGDGDLTQTTQFPGGAAAPRVTQNFYDWRDRLVASKQGVQASETDGTHRPITYQVYDNLNEVVSQQQYDGDGVSLTVSNGVVSPPAANLLRAETVTAYDNQGRVYQTQVFSVDPNNGTVSSTALTTNLSYDRRGNTIATAAPGGQVTKTVYDGAGRAVATYLTDGAGGSGWSDPVNVAGDNVLSETDTGYDPNGNVILTTTRQRFDNETALGALGNPATAPRARVSYVARYYDRADRLTATVDVGTNGGQAYSRPATVPGRSATVLVTGTSYNAAGWVLDVTDPRGLVKRTLYDNLGRTIKTIAAYVSPGTPTNATNQTTEYSYDGDGHVVAMKIDLPGNKVETTQYVYGYTSTAISSNDLLKQVRYPDPTTGVPSNQAANEENYSYDALGETIGTTDRNGTVHRYTYDVLGRQTVDAVTTLGAGVDGRVRRLVTSYDSAGRPYLDTSYNAASGGAIVNQVEQIYNGLGQLTAEYQAHTGAVNPATTPQVQYVYSQMAGGANHSRLVSMIYPNGRVLSYNYAAGVDNSISRLTSISDGTGILEAYTYLGLDTVVQRAHPQTGVNLSYINQPGGSTDGGDPYTGLDRFGRVADQAWVNATTGAYTDRFQYGYDPDANVLYRANLVDAVFSELYHASGPAGAYDALNRLTAFERGALSMSSGSSVPDTVAAPTASATWALDEEGDVTTDTTNGTPQTDNFNLQNEETAAGGAALAYSNAGATTTDQTGHVLVYDAWKRLVQVKNSTGTVLAGYAYDALGRRIQEAENGTTRDVYFSSQWQVLEERVGPAVQDQYVWSPVYVDALVERDGGGQRLYAEQDANWNVTALVNTSGSVVERFVYDPYGQVSVYNASWSATTDTYAWIYLHQGGRFDGVTGLYNFRNRDYSPVLGRWVEPDPLGYAAEDSNLYRAEGDAPTNATDPSGLVKVLVARQQAEGVALFAEENGELTWTETLIPFYDFYKKVSRLSEGNTSEFIGYLDGQTGLVNRNGSAVPLCKVEGLIATEEKPAWDEWFTQRNEYANGSTYATMRAESFDPQFLNNCALSAQQIEWLAKQGIYWTAGAGFLASPSRFAAVAPFSRPIIPTEGAAPFNNGGVLNAGRYAQTSYSNTFSAEGIQIYSRLAGRPINTIDELVAAVRAGDVSPSQIEVNYIVRPGGRTLILNTRTGQALEQAGIPRSQWNAINRTGDPLYERLLSEQLQRNNLTNSGIDNPVLDMGR